MVAVPVPCCGGLAPRACGVGLPEVTVSVCILNIFSWMCTAGTWPVHCVCSSYLVGCVMCGGVAKGSGTVDFFQHNHMNSTATLPCPCARLCRPAPRPGSRRELLGWREDGGPLLYPSGPASTALAPGFSGTRCSGVGHPFGLCPQCGAEPLHSCTGRAWGSGGGGLLLWMPFLVFQNIPSGEGSSRPGKVGHGSPVLLLCEGPHSCRSRE